MSQHTENLFGNKPTRNRGIGLAGFLGLEIVQPGWVMLTGEAGSAKPTREFSSGVFFTYFAHYFLVPFGLLHLGSP